MGINTLHQPILTVGPTHEAESFSLVACTKDDNFSVWQNIRTISAYHVVKPKIQNHALGAGRENTRRRKFAYNVRHEVHIRCLTFRDHCVL